MLFLFYFLTCSHLCCCSYLCCCSLPWLLPTHGCSPLVVPCPLLLLACSYFPPMATPCLLFPTHQCSSLMAIPNSSMIPTYNHSSLVVPCPSLLHVHCYSLAMVAPRLSMRLTCGCSPLVVPHPLLILTMVVPPLLFLAHHCSLVVTPRSLLFPYCYSLPIIAPAFLKYL